MKLSPLKSLCGLLFLFNIIPSSVPFNYEEIKLFESPVTYSIESTVLLNDFTSHLKEVGYKIKSLLTVESLWTNSIDEHLLKFQVRDAHVWARDAGPHGEFSVRKSALDSTTLTHFLVRWRAGRVIATLLPPDDTVDIANYKKSLASLFQFQISDGSANETDVSGLCDVQYLATTSAVKKVKRSCVVEMDGGTVSSQRWALVTRSERGLVEVLVEEEHVVRAAGGAGVRARVWVQLTARSHGPHVAPHATADAALAAHEPLVVHSLSLVSPPYQEEVESLTQAVKVARIGLLAVRGAEDAAPRREEAARAIRRVVRALRAPGLQGAEVRAVLQQPDNQDILEELVACAGAAGSAAALAGVSGALQPDAEAHRRLMRSYLSALAAADSAPDVVVTELVRMWNGEGTWSQWRDLADSALLAAAARAGRGAAGGAVRGAVLRALARCSTSECRALHLRAVGNLEGDAKLADLLLKHAEQGSEDEALAAIEALDEAGERASGERLLRLATSGGACRGRGALAVRAAALAAGVRGLAARGGGEAERRVVAEADRELRARGPRELRRLLHSLLVTYPVLQPSTAAPSWHDLAQDSMSTALLRRATSVQDAGVAASLWSLQAGAGGVLRRAEVVLRAHAGSDLHLLTVDVRTRGMEALSGGVAHDDDTGEAAEEEDATADLYLSMGGARAAGVRLFTGQAELLALVWAGAASQPLRVGTLAQHRVRYVTVPTAAGVWLRAAADLTLLLSLDAQADVSLWSRVADTRLYLQAGVVWKGTLQTAGGWCDVRGAAREEAGPALTVAATLDVYSVPRVCVNTRYHNYNYTVEVSGEERVLGGAHRARRARRTVTFASGNTLVLDARNSRVCREMH